MSDEYIWAQKYRPTTIEECIIPESVKNELRSYIEGNDIPHFLFCSESPGTGKTTVAKVLCSEINCDFLFLNASMENSIANLRTTVAQFVSTLSLNGGIKIVILDEADNLSQDAQKGLKGLMEEFSSNARFILTCNNRNNIFNPIISRCNVIEFSFCKEDLKYCASGMLKRCIEILNSEGIEYDKKTVARIISKYIPDNRNILNKLQSFSVKYGKIDSSVLQEMDEADITTLLDHLRNKKFINFRDWVFNNGSSLSSDFYSKFYRSLIGKIPASTEPSIILAVADYQYKHNYVASVECNVLAFLTEIAASDLGG